jgi:hypothetical protein
MRLLKRVLIFATEVVGLILGFVISLSLAVYFDSRETKFAAIAFWGGLILTVVVFFVFRRKTRKWKIELDAASWMANRVWRELHPHRARYVRIAHRTLLWLPSTCAALVLLFLPVASHILYSGAHLAPHYRFSISLNWLIIKSPGNDFTWTFFSNQSAARYGFTPIWFSHAMPSGATFSTSDPASSDGWWRPQSELASGHTSHVAVRNFQLGAITATCYEYRHIYDDGVGPSSSIFAPDVLWESLCSTQPNGVDYNLRAAFLGHRKDLAAFYDLLNSARLAN